MINAEKIFMTDPVDSIIFYLLMMVSTLTSLIDLTI